MKNFIYLFLLSCVSLSSSAYINVSDEIDDMISSFDICSDAQNPEIFESMLKELEASDEKNQEHPFYISTSRYFIEFKSETNSCQVYVDPYDANCYTPVCE